MPLPSLLRGEKKKIPFKILLSIDKALGHPRAPLEMYNETQVVLLPANTASILWPVDPGVTSTLKSYCLRNIELAKKFIPGVPEPKLTF